MKLFGALVAAVLQAPCPTCNCPNARCSSDADCPETKPICNDGTGLCEAPPKRVWKMCMGKALEPANAVEMQMGIVQSTKYCCTPEYSFPEICHVDWQGLTPDSPDFSDCGALEMDIARNEPGDKAGYFDDHGLSSGVIICTTGTAVLEMAEDESAGTVQPGDLVTVRQTCDPQLYSFEEIQDRALLRTRIEFLQRAGVPRPPTCPKELGGVGHEYGLALTATSLPESGTLLKDLLSLSEEELFCEWRVLGFKAKQYKKLVVRELNHTGATLEMYMFGKHKLEVRAEGAVLAMRGAEPEHLSSSLQVTSFVEDLQGAPPEEPRSFVQAEKGIKRSGEQVPEKGIKQGRHLRRVGFNSLPRSSLSTQGSFVLTAGAF